MYNATVWVNAKWQECTMTEEEITKAVDSARQIKMISTLGLSVADLGDIRDFLQQKRDEERAKSSNDTEGAPEAKKQNTGE